VNPRPVGTVRAAAAVVLLLAIAVVLGLGGVVSLGAGRTGAGVGGVVLALLLGISATGVAARAVVDRRPPRTGPHPGRWDDEPALVVPRDPAPTAVSSWTLAGLGAVLLLGGLVLVVLGEAGGVVLLVLGAPLLLVAGPHRRDLAGGVWLTPTRLVHRYRGRQWIVRWSDVVDLAPGSPIVVVPADRLPAEQRYGPRGRAWRATRVAGPVGVLGVETEGLPLGEAELAGLLRRALDDPRPIVDPRP